MEATNEQVSFDIQPPGLLKDAGLGVAGLGAASITAPPVFHDLDEAMASPLAVMKRPSYVKEVDKPTVEIDWNMLQPFDYTEVMWTGGLRKAVGPDRWDELFRIQMSNRLKGIKEGQPGRTLRDDAFLNCDHWAPISFMGPGANDATQTPDQPGRPALEWHARRKRSYDARLPALSRRLPRGLRGAREQ